jgi:hypothetical protein
VNLAPAWRIGDTVYAMILNLWRCPGFIARTALSDVRYRYACSPAGGSGAGAGSGRGSREGTTIPVFPETTLPHVVRDPANRRQRSWSFEVPFLTTHYPR